MRALTPTGRRRLERGVRGFTLLEVVVTAVVASVIFLMLTRWVLTLGTVASTGLEVTTPSRAAAYAETRLSADLSAATACDVQARNPVRSLSMDTLEVYTRGFDASGEPATFLARYHVAGTVLSRSLTRVYPETGKCGTAGTFYGDRVLASSVRTPTAARPAFTALVDGEPQNSCTVQESTDDTGTTRTASVGAACHAQAITVDLVLRSGGADPAPVPLTRTITVPAPGSGL